MRRPFSAAFAMFLLFVCAFFGAHLHAQPAAAKTNDEKFGKLPPNPVSSWELSDVRGEIAIEHFLDPAVFQKKLPQGFRPVTVAEAAQGSPPMAKWLESNAGFSNYYVATLLFSSTGRWTIDGTDIAAGGRHPLAAWWIWGNAAPPLDKVAQGGVGLQLAAWFPDSGPDRKKLAIDPTVEFAKVEMADPHPGEWHIRLKFKGGEITAACRAIGERTEMKYPLPQYTTIFLGGPVVSRYVIYTYYGHHMRDMQADWKFTGEHPLVRSLKAMKNIRPAQTVLQDGWVARAGVYILEK